MRTAVPRGGRLLPAAAGGLALFAFAAMGLMIAAAAAYVLLTNTHPRGFFLLYACVPALCLAGAAVLLPAERLGRRAFLILLFTAALVLKGTAALTVTPRLESDFYLLHYAAEQLAQGNNILNDTSYFQLWPYQSFFVAVLAGVMKLFGASPVVFRLMNALLSALTNLLVYALARRFASERGPGWRGCCSSSTRAPFSSSRCSPTSTCRSACCWRPSGPAPPRRSGCPAGCGGAARGACCWP